MQFVLKKKFVVLALTTSLLLWLVSYAIFSNQCFSAACSSDVIRSLLMPSFWLFAPMTALIFCFLFLPEHFFRSWLKQVAWWYLPVLLVIIASTPVYSSNVLSVDRSQVAFAGIVLLAVITVPYLLWRRQSVRGA